MVELWVRMWLMRPILARKERWHTKQVTPDEELAVVVVLAFAILDSDQQNTYNDW